MSSEVKIHVWHTGRVLIDQALAFQEKSWHPAPYTGWLRPSAKKSWFPVSAYLVEHPKGLVLIDTGWSEAIRTEPRKHLGWFSSSMFKGSLPEGESVRERLAAHGVRDRDIAHVILTHLHADHVSGIGHVSNARNIITSEIEWRAAQKRMGYVRSMWKGVSIRSFSLEDIPYGPHKSGIDLFGDGSLYLVHTPGHSEGQVSVLVRTNDKWVLLASDVGYSEASWRRNILPGVVTNQNEAKQSLNWIKEFSSREDCVATLANHDPAIQPQTIG